MPDDRSLYRELTAVGLAARPWKYPAARDSAIAFHTDLRISQAWALINSAIDRDDVNEVLPVECRLLRGRREAGRAARAAR